MVDLAAVDPDSRAFRCIRGDRISMIFQEPMTSLSPLHTIGEQIVEALLLHRPMKRREGRDIVEQMLRMVGYPDPGRAYDTYPFELSGGLRQRAMIAMALVCHPALLIADEPSTALDVTIQAQILKLIQDLQAELGMAVLIITHDLGVVANVAEEVVVVYHGEIMESGTLEDIFRRPSHPYLKALLKAVPHFEMADGERLAPLREIKLETGHLLSGKPPRPVAERRPAPARRAPRDQELLDAQRQRLVRSGVPCQHPGRRRRELPGAARRVPGPGWGKWLRQDDREQDRHASAGRRQRPGGLRRQRHGDRPADLERQGDGAPAREASSTYSRTPSGPSTHA